MPGIRHTLVLGKIDDDSNTTKSRPSDWNATHEITNLPIAKLASNAKGSEFLGSTVLASAAVTTGALTISTRKSLFILVRSTGLSVADKICIRLNGNSGANYWDRHIKNNATLPNTFDNLENPSTTLWRLQYTATLQPAGVQIIMNNLSTNSKIALILPANSTGSASTANTLDYGWGEYVSNTQVTTIELLTLGGTATLGAGSGFSVFGKD